MNFLQIFLTWWIPKARLHRLTLISKQKNFAKIDDADYFKTVHINIEKFHIGDFYQNGGSGMAELHKWVARKIQALQANSPTFFHPHFVIAVKYFAESVNL